MASSCIEPSFHVESVGKGYSRRSSAERRRQLAHDRDCDTMRRKEGEQRVRVDFKLHVISLISDVTRSMA
jgi:hypothetical protein